MTDIAHQWGSDLEFGPTGDVALVEGTVFGQQRVLRRLLTNPLDYIWHPTYGAGLASFVGQPANNLQIGAVIRSQISKELVVAQDPAPTINVVINPGGVTGVVYVSLQYVDAPSGETQALTLSVDA